MCGRYTLAKPMKSIESHFGPLVVEGAHQERYNIAPGQRAPVVGATGEKRWMKPMTWGLVTPWARERASGFINARAETAAGKPSFRDAFRKRRCLVPADGFLEWEKGDAGKIPHYFRLRSAGLFAFAGLYEETRECGTFTILTTRANALVAPWHDRMPVILAPEAYAPWLSPRSGAADLQALLTPCGAGAMEQFIVSSEINSPANDRPSCIEPVRA